MAVDARSGSIYALIAVFVCLWYALTGGDTSPTKPAASLQTTMKSTSAAVRDDKGKNRSTTASETPKGKMQPLIAEEEQVSNCPDEEIYVALWALVRKPSRWTMVDVGANKGYSVGGLLEALNVSWFSRQKVGLEIYRYGQLHSTPAAGTRHSLCGACCDCTMSDPWEALSAHPWVIQQRSENRTDAGSIVHHGADIWLFDGTRSHIEFTKHFFTKENAVYRQQHPKAPLIEFHFEQKAVSNRAGVFPFPQEPLGSETSSIRASPGRKGEDVAVVSLGAYLPPSVDTIDVLLTDTEGHDFDVYEGIYDRFVKPGKVGIYVFEIHVGPNNRTLFSVVEELYAAGYMCYFTLSPTTYHQWEHGHKVVKGKPTRRHVVPISAEHWLPHYEQLRGWSNVVCANERRYPELRGVFEVLQELPRRHWYQHCSSKIIYQAFFTKYPRRNWAWAMT